MSKWKVWALAALALASWASASFAITRGAPWLKTESVPWRFHAIAYSSTGNNDVVGWYSDSVAFNRVGSGGATMSVANAETSTVIATTGWSLPPSAPGLGGTSIDSTLICRIAFSDAGATNTNIDSLDLALQVSYDGKNWVYVNQILNVAGTNPITSTSPGESSFQLLNAAGATTTTPKVFSVAFHSGAETGHYPYRYNFWQWPLLRVICINKTVSGYQHNFNLYVTHWDTRSSD